MACSSSKGVYLGIVVAFAALSICASTLLVLADAEASHSNNVSFEWPSDENKAYFREAVIYQIRKNRDVDMLLQLDEFTRLAEAGASEAEIEEGLEKISRRLGGVPMHVRNRTGYDEGIKLGFAAVGFRAHPSPLGIAGGYAFAEAMLQLYDDVAGDKKQARAIQRRAAALGGQRIEGEVLDRALEAYGNRPELDFLRYFPGMGIKPGDSEDVIGNQLPELRQFKAILNIDNGVERNAQLIKFTRAQISEVRKEISRGVGEVNKNIQAVNGKLSAYVAYQYEIAEGRKQQEIKRVKMEGLRSAAYLATTFVSFADPEAGKRVAAVANTAFQLYDAVEAFSAATKLADGLTGFASLALTGNFVSAGLSLINVFLDTQTSEEMILEEIGKLREQVARMHKDMHDRFDRVDRQLNGIHETLISGLNTLHTYLITGDQDIKAELKIIRGQLASHEERLADLSNLVIDLTDVVIDRIDAAQIRPCVDWKTSISPGDPIDRDSFIECLLQIHGLATGPHLENLQLNTPSNHSDAVDRLRNYPDRTVKQSLQAFREKSKLDVGLRAVIVGPKAWFSLADLYDRFLSDWPEHSGALAEKNEYAESMRRYRESLVQFIEAIRGDYLRFLQLDENSAIASWFKDIRKTIGELKDKIEELVDRSDKDGERLAWSYAYLEHDSGNNPRTRHRDLSEKAWQESFVFVSPRDCPYSRARRFHQLSSRLLKSVEKNIKGAIEDSHPGFVNMINTGMAKIYVCAAQDVRRRKAGPGDEVRLGTSGFGWDHGLEAQVYIGMQIEVACDDKTEIKEFEGDADVYMEHRIITAHKRFPPNLEYYHNDIIRDLYRNAITELELNIWEEYWKYLGFEDERCTKNLKNRYHRKRAEVSDSIKHKLQKHSYFLQLEREIELANAYISSWLQVAIHDALPRSDLVQSIVSGRTGFPSPKAVLDGMRSEKSEYVWTLPDRLLQKVDEFANALRSPYFAHIMREEYGNSKVMQTTYLGID